MGYFQKYAIAAGYNVALGSLVNIEAITVSNEPKRFALVKAEGLYDPGLRAVRGDGSDYWRGYASVSWLFDAMTRKQLDYLRTTYCSGDWGGPVTIYTTLGSDYDNNGAILYYRMNAYMRLQKPKDVQGEFFAYRRYFVDMTRLTAAS